MRWACLLAGLAVEVVHRVDRNCVATDGVDVVHGNLPQKSQLVVQGFRPGESPLYNGNSTRVIPLHVVSRRVADINLDSPDFTSNHRHPGFVAQLEPRPGGGRNDPRREVTAPAAPREVGGQGRASAAIRSTASMTSSGAHARLRRTCPRPSRPNAGPFERARRERSSSTDAGSSPQPYAERSIQAR